MTDPDGHLGEMPAPTLDDRALEALLNGAAPAQSGLDWLQPFVEELGRAALQPAPVVRPALAALLRDGSTPPATAAATIAPPPRRRDRGRLSRLSLLAKVGLGVSVAVATATAAGAAGVLPDPAQRAVATVVEATTPFTFPDQADGRAEPGATVSADATGASDGESGVDVPPPAAGHGVGPTPAVTGIARANETPAAGHVPTSIPAGGGQPANPGTNAGNGLSTAANTPAAGNVPSSVPAVTAPGRDTSATTPAATRPTNPNGRP